MGCAAAAGAVIAGISEAVAAVGTFFAGAGASIASGLGVAGTTLGGVGAGSLIGTGLEGAAIGGLGGAALNAVTGKPILPGLAEGALVGGAVGGLGPAIGGALGGGAVAGTAGDILAGAGAGALGGAAIPGAGGPGQGAIGGATAGLVSGLSGVGTSPEAMASPTTGGPGASALGIAAPPGLPDTTGGAFGATTGAPAPTATGVTTSFGGAPAGGDIYGGAGGATTGTALTSLSSPSAVAGATTGTELAPTDVSGLAAFQGNVPQGTAELGASLTTPAAGATQTPDTGIAASTTQGLGGVSSVDPGNLPTPPVPPYGTDASGLSVAPAATGPVGEGQLNPGFGKGFAATPGVNALAGTETLSPASGATSGNTFSNLTHDIGAGNFSNLPSDLGNFASKNAGLLLGAGTIGMDLLKGNQPVPGEQQVSGIANQLSSQATQLQGYLTSGTLPPGVHTALTQAGAAAKAAIRSQYASRGMSGSSAEVQDLANVDNTLVSQGATIATTLLNQGISEANLAAGLYGKIMESSLAQDSQLSSALATLAASASRPTITVSPSGQLVQAGG